MKIQVLGAAREVTGSCYLVESGRLRFLVDCGMFQGGREAETRNRRFPAGFNPDSLDFVLLTHAHIDHSGLLPRLVSLGFKGPVYCTDATADLLGVMLPDSAHIAEKEAEWKNYSKRKRRGELRGETAPLYTVEQARTTLKRLRRKAYDEGFELHGGKVRVCFRDAGHILGSSIIEVWLEEGGKVVKLVFSGDIGMPRRPLMNDPTPIAEADYLFVESTYGNRLHKSLEQTVDELAFAINDTVQRKKGNVIIPSFAVGRTQEILYFLLDLIRQERIQGSIAIFVDSPMAASATEITLRHLDILDEDAHRLADWEQRNNNRLPYIRFTESPDDSMALNNIRQGAVILSASGMCDAGRIKHHLKNNLPREECTVVISGFQAAGTLGRRLVDGASYVRIFGESIPVRASVYTLGGLSAHADRDALLAWLSGFAKPPRRTFVVHGEEETALGFADSVRERFGWTVEVPEIGSVYTLPA